VFESCPSRSTVESRGYRINYQIIGDAADAIVLLHGHMQAAEDSANAGYADPR
jgi:hypothetical protein